jgi:hypothetical protein
MSVNWYDSITLICSPAKNYSLIKKKKKKNGLDFIYRDGICLFHEGIYLGLCSLKL